MHVQIYIRLAIHTDVHVLHIQTVDTNEPFLKNQIRSELHVAWELRSTELLLYRQLSVCHDQISLKLVE